MWLFGIVPFGSLAASQFVTRSAGSYGGASKLIRWTGAIPRPEGRGYAPSLGRKPRSTALWVSEDRCL